MNEKIYDIDYQKLVTWLTPVPMRKSILLTFLTRLILPFVSLYQSFLLYRQAKIYQLMITPQKCYLERLLNDRYDFTGRRIYITDGVAKPATYIYMEEELKPVYLGSKFLYTTGETSDMADDFIIFVPMDIIFELAEMTSIVKAYKLAGTKFKIQRI